MVYSTTSLFHGDRYVDTLFDFSELTRATRSVTPLSDGLFSSSSVSLSQYIDRWYPDAPFVGFFDTHDSAHVRETLIRFHIALTAPVSCGFNFYLVPRFFLLTYLAIVASYTKLSVSLVLIVCPGTSRS